MFMVVVALRTSSRSISIRTHQTPALRELAELLNVRMAVKHDSVVDARVALLVAAASLVLTLALPAQL